MSITYKGKTFSGTAKTLTEKVMPMVKMNGKTKKFPYTAAGKLKAKLAAKKAGKKMTYKKR